MAGFQSHTSPRAHALSLRSPHGPPARSALTLGLVTRADSCGALIECRRPIKPTLEDLRPWQPLRQRRESPTEQQQELDDVFARATKALAIIETYDQARVDRLCQAVAWAVANKQTFTRLVDEGIAESGLGDAVSRMGKRMKIRGVLRDALRQKSVGIIEETAGEGHREIRQAGGNRRLHRTDDQSGPDALPATPIYGIKARDVVIFSPHPRSKKTSFETVRLMREALEREGAPADILQCLTKVNIPMSQALMARADLIVATGGQPMVRAALQLGHAGVRRRVRQLDDDHRRDRQHRGSGAQHAAVQDLGLRLRLLGRRQPSSSRRRSSTSCSPSCRRKAVTSPSPEQKEMLRKAMWDEERHRTVETVAIAPQQLAKAAGFDDSRRPQVHHRARRRHRQGAPLTPGRS